MSRLRIVSLPIEVESDIVAVRQRARLLADHLQFGQQDQTRLATAVSEIARNAFTYGKGGRAEFAIDEIEGQQALLIRVIDRGAGIKDLDEVLEGRSTSTGGMGLGIAGARRLLDRFDVTTGPQGTCVELGLKLPSHALGVTPERLAGITALLGRSREEDPLHVVREQNRELLQSLDDSRRRQEESEQLSRELEDTNRGVVALYAELDARAEQLREASETKSRFLSNMSHEFRTPLNSIIALSGLLLDGLDGPLSTEQEKQIGYIRKSAQDLLEMVGDLLDLAKVEAGKLDATAQRFTIAELFSTLRGALRPLRHSSEVELIFAAVGELPEMVTDEGKLAQILRNLISNALKFTEAGEVHVSAHHDSHARMITFAVSDTGIGISPKDQERIFEEFTQVEGRLQKTAKGTGLGLPLSRRLAGLLGGELWCESEPGKGSTFYLSTPIELPGITQGAADDARKNILVIDDDETFRYVLQQILTENNAYNVFEATDGETGLDRIRALRPDLVILDLQMPLKNGFDVVRELRADPDIARQPLIVCTSLHLDLDALAQLPAGIPILQKHSVSRERVRTLLNAAFGEPPHSGAVCN